jgi:hypothetical protein
MILLINKYEKYRPFKFANPLHALWMQQQIYPEG